MAMAWPRCVTFAAITLLLVSLCTCSARPGPAVTLIGGEEGDVVFELQVPSPDEPATTPEVTTSNSITTEPVWDVQSAGTKHSKEHKRREHKHAAPHHARSTEHGDDSEDDASDDATDDSNDDSEYSQGHGSSQHTTRPKYPLHEDDSSDSEDTSSSSGSSNKSGSSKEGTYGKDGSSHGSRKSKADSDSSDSTGNESDKGSSSKHGRKSRPKYPLNDGEDGSGDDEDSSSSSSSGSSKGYPHTKSRHNKHSSKSSETDDSSSSSSGSKSSGGQHKRKGPKYPQSPKDNSNSDSSEGADEDASEDSSSNNTHGGYSKGGKAGDKGDSSSSSGGGSSEGHRGKSSRSGKGSHKGGKKGSNKGSGSHDNSDDSSDDSSSDNNQGDNASGSHNNAGGDAANGSSGQTGSGSGSGSAAISEDVPIPQPPAEVTNVYVGSGTFVWRTLAVQTSSSSPSGLGEVPYFPSLRGPRRRGASGAQGSSPGVTSPMFQLLVNTKTADVNKGFYGTSDPDPETFPSDEALLVGPVEDGTASGRNRRYVLHSVNRVAEIFVAYSNGTLVPDAAGFTRISLQSLMSVTNIATVSSLVAGEPTGYYDQQSKRYVLIWLATAPNSDVEPLLFVAVSKTSDPLGVWVVKALRVKPSYNVFRCSCSDNSQEPFFANYPQVTYNNEGVYVSLGLVCNSDSGSSSLSESFKSAIFAYSKTVLYSVPTTGNTQTINTAVWISAKAWYRSVPASSSAQLSASLNNFIQPVRPQTLEDVFNGPFFVQKVDDSYMSLATLSSARLSAMVSLETAPRLTANIVSRNYNFSNGAEYEGLNAMSQPETDIQLFSGDTGLVGRGYAVRSYGAVLFQGSVFLTTSEFYGSGAQRTPSIYWAIVDPGSPSLATGALSVLGAGVIASKDCLALGFPVIAALSSGDGAVIAYSYSKSGDVTGLGPAYPGVATTTVRNFGISGSASIDVVKAGEGSITIPPVDPYVQRWGDYSAAEVIDGKIWFAVPTTKLMDGYDPMIDAGYATWISNRDLE